jgi:hypothetical protein
VTPLGGVNGAGVAILDVRADVASRQRHAYGPAGRAVGGVRLHRDLSPAGGRDPAGHPVAHRDRGAVGLGDPVVAAQDDLVADRERDRVTIVGRPVRA